MLRLRVSCSSVLDSVFSLGLLVTGVSRVVELLNCTEYGLSGVFTYKHISYITAGWWSCQTVQSTGSLGCSPTNTLVILQQGGGAVKLYRVRALWGVHLQTH